MRKIWIGTAVTLVGLVAALAVPGSAAAGNGMPPCGNICDFKDPNSYVFDPNHQIPDDEYLCTLGATTVKSVTTISVSLQLRYGPYCEVTWVRITPGTVPTYSFWDLKHFSKYTNGTIRQVSINDWVGGSNWTLMLNDHNLLNSFCVYEYFNENDYHTVVPTTTCSGSY